MMMQKAADRNAINRLYHHQKGRNYQYSNAQKRTLQDNSVNFRTFSGLTETVNRDNLNLFEGSDVVGEVDYGESNSGECANTCRIFLLSAADYNTAACVLQ